MTDVRRISIVMFDGFELLDVFGPVGLVGHAPGLISVEFVGPSAGPVRSSQGTECVATVSYDEAATPDVVLVPGGKGTRSLVSNDSFVTWLGSWAENTEMVTSICTGSSLLAASGLLDGYRATTNKRAFEWATPQNQPVEWAAQARWVEDRDRWTWSGVAAGMDMAADLLAHFFGETLVEQVSGAIELEVHTDSAWDPFAAANGLTQRRSQRFPVRDTDRAIGTCAAGPVTPCRCLSCILLWFLRMGDALLGRVERGAVCQ